MGNLGMILLNCCVLHGSGATSRLNLPIGPPLPPGTSPQSVFGIDATGRAQRWPLPYTYVGWEVKISGLTAGDYEIRARSVDVNGFAQPEPRPVQKTGRNSIGCRRVKIV